MLIEKQMTIMLIHTFLTMESISIVIAYLHFDTYQFILKILARYSAVTKLAICTSAKVSIRLCSAFANIGDNL